MPVPSLRDAFALAIFACAVESLIPAVAGGDDGRTAASSVDPLVAFASRTTYGASPAKLAEALAWQPKARLADYSQPYANDGTIAGTALRPLVAPRVTLPDNSRVYANDGTQVSHWRRAARRDRLARLTNPTSHLRTVTIQLPELDLATAAGLRFGPLL